METERRIDLERLQEWIGRRETKRDAAQAWPVAALSATLDRQDTEPKEGDSVPPGWHWLYFLDTTPASGLGPDGLPHRGGFLPPVPLPRRMWAGGRLEFRRPILIGERLQRDSEVISVEGKHGRSGPLVFVTVRHTVSASGEIATVEEHDIVYREAAKPGESPAHGKTRMQPPLWRREIISDTVLLFRFSALIFNAHRIHFDIDYCREEAGYPGLLVHGPLQTLLMLDLCRRHAPRPVRKFAYRALLPLFHTEHFSVNGIPAADGAAAELSTANAAGASAMVGTASF